jgi:hypothetical protein
MVAKERRKEEGGRKKEEGRKKEGRKAFGSSAPTR